MFDPMGIFHTSIDVASTSHPDRRRTLHHVMVDTGSEYNWVPRPLLEELGVTPERTGRFETVDGRSDSLSYMRPAGQPSPLSCSRTNRTWCCLAHTGLTG